VNRHVANEYPIWLRTCYKPELEAKYQELRDQCEVCDEYGVDEACAFEDAALYSAEPVLDGADGDGGELRVLLLRAPMLADILQFRTVEEAEEYIRQQDVENEEAEGYPPERTELFHASRNATWLAYLVDEEVLTDGRDLVKVMWMDVHGRCVWHNRIKPEAVGPFRGALANAKSLAMYVEEQTIIEAQGREDDRWKKGATFWPQ
jgi:hypothetical protein